jgi:hypothetical protein
VESKVPYKGNTRILRKNWNFGSAGIWTWDLRSRVQHSASYTINTSCEIMTSFQYICKAEHFCQVREAFKNCSLELFFWPFETLILIFSAIFWYCMITRQLIVKKCRLTTPEMAKKKFRWAIFEVSRNWQKCSALELWQVATPSEVHGFYLN